MLTDLFEYPSGPRRAVAVGVIWDELVDRKALEESNTGLSVEVEPIAKKGARCVLKQDAVTDVSSNVDNSSCVLHQMMSQTQRSPALIMLETA